MRYGALLLLATGAWISQAQAQLFAPSAPAAVARTLSSKPGSLLSQNSSSLPFGMNYNREAKGVMLPLDAGNTWNVGVGDLGVREGLDGAPGRGFRLNNLPAPGAVLQHRF